MTWVAADNNYQYTMYSGEKYYTESGAAHDPFPYGSVNAFNSSSTPAAKFYNKNSDGTYFMDSSVESITQNSNGIISFVFKAAPSVKTPTFSVPEGRYIEQQTVAISCETEGVTIFYTIDGTTPTTESPVYSEPLTISETTTLKAIAVSVEGEESRVATATYTIVSNSDENRFKLIKSTDEMPSGSRCIIACGSNATAAGSLLNDTYLKSVDITAYGDIIIPNSNVTVFIATQQPTGGWTFADEATQKYLYAYSAKKLGYGDTPFTWSLEQGTNGVIMSAESKGVMLFNVNSPRFNTYTSAPNKSMIQANIYMAHNSDVSEIIDAETLPISTQSTAIYTLDGRRLNTKPTMKGIYIVNGKKVVF